MLAEEEECDAERFTGLRVKLRRRTALSGTTNEAFQRANMGNGRIAALARQYNNVVVIIQMARSIRTACDFRRMSPVPLWGAGAWG